MTDPTMSVAEIMRHTLLKSMMENGPQPIAEQYVEAMFGDVNIIQWCKMTSVHFTKYRDSATGIYFFEFFFKDRPDYAETEPTEPEDDSAL